MKVLLAKKFDAAKHNVDGWLASEKLDGMRAFWDGSELLSRNGKRIAAPDWFTASLPPDAQLDGELFIGRGQFQKTVSVCRKQVPVDLEWRQVKFMAFDLLTSGSPTFHQRYELLSRMKLPPRVQVVEHRETMTADVPALLRQYEAVGAEGVMLRDPAIQYSAQGKVVPRCRRNRDRPSARNRQASRPTRCPALPARRSNRVWHRDRLYRSTA